MFTCPLSCLTVFYNDRLQVRLHNHLSVILQHNLGIRNKRLPSHLVSADTVFMPYALVVSRCNKAVQCRSAVKATGSLDRLLIDISLSISYCTSILERIISWNKPEIRVSGSEMIGVNDKKGPRSRFVLKHYLFYVITRLCQNR